MEYSATTGKIEIPQNLMDIAEELDKMLSGRVDENDRAYTNINQDIDGVTTSGEDYADMD